jgi:hypothetical protein
MSKEIVLIGKTLEEAQEILRNCNFRVIKQDGKSFSKKDDVKPSRYNLSLTEGKVVEVTFG